MVGIEEAYCNTVIGRVLAAMPFLNPLSLTLSDPAGHGGRETRWGSMRFQKSRSRNA